ncbi:MAG: hypothetical protein V3U65_07715 [Granulosicoccaceae bacterium]
MKTKNATVDSGKRHTLKRMIGTAGATATLVSSPSIASLNSEKNAIHFSKADRQIGSHADSGKIVINATLVSIPGTTNETLLLKNLTDKPLTVDRFEHALITFDGEAIDCGVVCDNAVIIIPANKHVMVHFSSLPIELQSTAANNAFNVQAVVTRLPEGTRVIPLNASVEGTTATLLQA